jgi:hypothetical protein
LLVFVVLLLFLVQGVAKLFLFDLSTGLPLSNLTLLRDLPSGQMVLLLDTEASVFEESTN